MKRFGMIFVGILLLISFTLNGYFISSHRQNMTVLETHDGDTFTLGDGQRVKLLGVNAPELGNCGSEEARIQLRELVFNKTIRLTEEKRDMYGRRMGLVWVGNTLVNEELLASGFARPDYTKNTENERLKAAYRMASENNLGIHSSLCKKISPTPPSEKCDIKGNIDKGTWDHLYHLPKCRHYNQIILDEDLGEKFFCSEKEAQDAGFTIAPDCLR